MLKKDPQKGNKNKENNTTPYTWFIGQHQLFILGCFMMEKFLYTAPT